jgi:hypothetical protein
MKQAATIDHILAQIQKQLNLSKEREYELLAEIRTHLEDAVADAVAKGEDEEVALLKAAERLGAEEVGMELQEVHTGWDSIDAIVLSALPVLFALILRWLAFAPDGSALAWPALLARPAFWVVAIVALVVPFVQFHQWRLALLGWGFFWLLTVIFVMFPSINQW